MMATLVLRFPGGRYHATPSGHHVNEGLVEWPPSPWRIVRALIACGYSTQHWEQLPVEGRRLVEALSSALPEYRLPRASLGHSRHYMPIGRLDSGREKTTLVLDGELKHSPGKRPTKAQQRKIDEIESAYPLDLIDCLQRDTAWWKERKWSQAPGTQSVLYWRESQALEVGSPSSTRVSRAPRAEMMLLALTTPSGSKSGLPSVVRTLPQAELLHKALVSKLGFVGEPCPELVGRDERGERLKGHAHAHILPLDLDGDGQLDHVVVFAPMGLGARAQRAVRGVRRTFMKGGIGELQVAIAGVGALSDLRAIGARLADAVEKLLGPTDGARSWVSATPLVPPRHVKKRGRSSLRAQVEAELRVRGFPSPKVEVLERTGETLALRHFVRRRQRGPQPPIDAGFAIRLHFDTPVVGPICLGYASHFGLGRFSAE
jgi:CRISPR-associated protein Csb2